MIVTKIKELYACYDEENISKDTVVKIFGKCENGDIMYLDVTTAYGAPIFKIKTEDVPSEEGGIVECE